MRCVFDLGGIMADNLEALVQQQFGPQAAAYVASSVHAQGEDLQQLAALVAGKNNARALDLGCGGGHVSYTVAPHVGRVVAYDLSTDMTRAVALEAAKRGFANIETANGVAESLPFEDASFDFVLCRMTAHHWGDVLQGLKEARRVIKPDGAAAFIDIVSPGDPLRDTFLQTIEILRDPSHVRDYSVAEWSRMAAQAGFRIKSALVRRLPVEMEAWFERMHTPDVHIKAIRSLRERMASCVKERFGMGEDGILMLESMAMELKPG